MFPKFKLNNNSQLKLKIHKKNNNNIINNLKNEINKIKTELPKFSLQKNCIGSLLKASNNDNSDALNMNNVTILGDLMLGSINVKTVLENLTQRIVDLENKINTYLL